MQTINHSPVIFTTYLLSSVLAAPSPQLLDYGENSGPVAGINPSAIPTVTTPSGSLYGSEQLLGGFAKPSPVSGGDSAIVSNAPLVNGQEADPKLGLYLDFNSVENPQPIRGTEGQTDPGPRTFEYEKLNPDLFAPPGTDSGSIPNAMWPLGLSHNRLGSGKTSGWARQQNVAQLPAATAMAGVDMRLAPNAYRELHWHTAGEWALMLKGSVRLAAINDEGESFLDDIGAGDIWFFPAGVPHSIQALEEGAEFLIVFDDGNFNEDGTFLVTEMFLRTPTSVLSKDLGAPISALASLPKEQLYIFDGTPAPTDISAENVTSSAGMIPTNGSFTYHFSQQAPFLVPGGSVKVVDSTTFPAAKNFAAALVTVAPGAMREMHWHLTSDEWNYFLQGSARTTIYLAPDAAQTFDYTAGDVGYIPASNSHYIENTGIEDVVFLEVLQAPKFTDISVAQWLKVTPKQVVMDTLGLSEETIANLPKDKTYIKVGNTNMTALAASPNGTAALDVSEPDSSLSSAKMKGMASSAQSTFRGYHLAELACGTIVLQAFSMIL